jgi:hypothetical protein
MIFDIVDAMVRGQSKRAAAMPGAYRGYLIMTPHDLFPSIALHRVQAAPTAPVISNPGMPPQHMSMPGWPPFMWGGMPPWMQPPQDAGSQASPLEWLQQHYPHLYAIEPTPQLPVPAAVGVLPPSISSPVKGGADGILESLIMSEVPSSGRDTFPPPWATQVSAPSAPSSSSPAVEAEAGAAAKPAVTTPVHPRPPSAPSPARGGAGAPSTSPESRPVREGRQSPSPAAPGRRSPSRSRSRSPESEDKREMERLGLWRYGPQAGAGGRLRSEPRRGDRDEKTPRGHRRSRSTSRSRSRRRSRSPLHRHRHPRSSRSRSPHRYRSPSSSRSRSRSRSRARGRAAGFRAREGGRQDGGRVTESFEDRQRMSCNNKVRTLMGLDSPLSDVSDLTACVSL